MRHAGTACWSASLGGACAPATLVVCVAATSACGQATQGLDGTQLKATPSERAAVYTPEQAAALATDDPAIRPMTQYTLEDFLR